MTDYKDLTNVLLSQSKMVEDLSNAVHKNTKLIKAMAVHLIDNEEKTEDLTEDLTDVIIALIERVEDLELKLRNEKRKNFKST